MKQVPQKEPKPQKPETRPEPKPLAVEIVRLAELERDPAINCRAGGVNAETAAEYAEAQKNGAAFPPAVAFRNPTTGALILADGFHRCAAAELIGADSISVEVRTGDRRAALLFAAGTNSGAPRTNADKRKAVLTLLGDEEWSAKSDRWIAAQCAVSDRFVNTLRRQHDAATAKRSQSAAKRVGRDGKARRTPRTAKRSQFSPARAAKRVGRELERAAKRWPKAEPTAPLVAVVQAWLAGLETTEAKGASK